jgi:hypothetical protein
MNRLSIRMILCIVALSALHISGITPVNPPAIRMPQEPGAAQGEVRKVDSRLGLGITAGAPGNRTAPWRPLPGNLAE